MLIFDLMVQHDSLVANNLVYCNALNFPSLYVCELPVRFFSFTRLLRVSPTQVWQKLFPPKYLVHSFPFPGFMHDKHIEECCSSTLCLTHMLLAAEYLTIDWDSFLHVYLSDDYLVHLSLSSITTDLPSVTTPPYNLLGVERIPPQRPATPLRSIQPSSHLQIPQPNTSFPSRESSHAFLLPSSRMPSSFDSKSQPALTTCTCHAYSPRSLLDYYPLRFRPPVQSWLRTLCSSSAPRYSVALLVPGMTPLIVTLMPKSHAQN